MRFWQKSNYLTFGLLLFIVIFLSGCDNNSSATTSATATTSPDITTTSVVTIVSTTDNTDACKQGCEIDYSYDTAMIKECYRGCEITACTNKCKEAGGLAATQAACISSCQNTSTFTDIKTEPFEPSFTSDSVKEGNVNKATTPITTDPNPGLNTKIYKTCFAQANALLGYNEEQTNSLCASTSIVASGIINAIIATYNFLNNNSFY